VFATAAAVALAGEHDHDAKLPAGPIRDRHELMEGIGKNAKTIGDALKSGKHDPIATSAEAIQASAGKILGLFPAGSTDKKSRAKPEIWTDWAKFEKLSKELATTAGDLAVAAKSGGDASTAANTMFGSCKSCHDAFRAPEKK
jgi:cytochrome c556